MNKNQYINAVRSKNPEVDIEIIARAFDYSKKAHKDQKRDSGEDYFIHPVQVSLILAELGMDSRTIASGLLHDVLEDTLATGADLEKNFGKEIFSLVMGVSDLGKIPTQNPKDRKRKTSKAQAESVRKLFIATAEDIRVLFIKLADRLHNLRTLSYKKRESQKRIAEETLNIYSPLADVLGIGTMKAEIEDLAFRYACPREYAGVKEKISEKVNEARHYLPRTEASISALLTENKIKHEVNGRIKHLYSTYKKLNKVEGEIDRIYDLNAIRIIVFRVADCYKALGLIHSLYRPMLYRIKDYIVMPKSNGYQSLHTTVIGAGGKIIEIQIRTKQMHEKAEYGIAAHWKYNLEKEKIFANGKTSETSDQEKKIANLLKNAAKKTNEPSSGIKGILGGSIFVFSPKNEIFELPEGATPVDFAYAVHSGVAERCIGAKINGKIVPLDTPLDNRDTVEIITSGSSGGPSRDWLLFAATTKAKQKIRQFLRQKNKNADIKIGQEIFAEDLRLLRSEKIEDISKDSWQRLFNSIPLKNTEDLFAAIGSGSVSASQMIRKLFAQKKNISLSKTSLQKPRSTSQEPKSITIEKGLKLIYSTCCNPQYGHEIVGFVTKGRGIAIHRENCKNVLSFEGERMIEVDWDNKIPQKKLIRIHTLGGDKFLREISWKIFKLGLTIKNMESFGKPENSNGKIEVEISSGYQSAMLRKELAGLENVRLEKH